MVLRMRVKDQKNDPALLKYSKQTGQTKHCSYKSTSFKSKKRYQQKSIWATNVTAWICKNI